MTNREFLSLVLNTCGTTIAPTVWGDDEQAVSDYCRNELAKLDARNDKRRNTLTKEQIANEGIKSEILSVLANGTMVASEIATATGYSTQKITALCKQLVDCNKVTASDVKVKGKGTVKAYKLAE